MRYNIERFSQERLIELGLDFLDVGILMFVIDFFNTSKMYYKIIDSKIYFWLNYQTIINELPLLRIEDKRAIQRRFQKYVKSGLMFKDTIKGIDICSDGKKTITRHGTFAYFSFNVDELEKLYHVNKKKIDIDIDKKDIKTSDEKAAELLKNKKLSTKKNSVALESPTGKNSRILPCSTQEYHPVVLESTNKDSYTIDSYTIDSNTIREEENLIIQEAEKSPEFTKAFSEFLLDDSNDYRKEKLYWIVHNAKKHNSTLKDIIQALQICYDKDKVGDMSYFTGILRMKDKNRSEGVKPIGKPVQWIADEFLRERVEIHNEFVKQYDIDLNNNKLYYSIYKNEDKEIYNEDRTAVFNIMNLITADLKKETGVLLTPEFRI
ncbi:MAG TPA: hypothetical protein VMZ91_11105 [Candidatus Paceibacterota bacterium]|nr:hypothetical protein [Candidatus Paceibacterota bacterium]